MGLLCPRVIPRRLMNEPGLEAGGAVCCRHAGAALFAPAVLTAAHFRAVATCSHVASSRHD